MIKVVNKEEWEIKQNLINAYKKMVEDQADQIGLLKDIDKVNESLVKNLKEQVELLKSRVEFLERYNSVLSGLNSELKEQLESYAEDEAGASR